MEISFIPQFILNRITHNDMLKIHYNILLSNILIIFLFLSGYISIISMVPHFCIADKILHVPCPGCDITGGIVEILTLKNLSLSPTFILFVIICQIPLRIVAIIKNNKSKFIIKVSKFINNIAILLFLLIYSFKILN